MSSLWVLVALKDTAVPDDCSLVWSSILCSNLLKLIDNLESFKDLAEYDVVTIEMWSWFKGDEEL